ncbi:hypothetical protein CVS40_4730 [Lucilia cuprina]|nr:hypothetical protein CVS40_4730 [Lucilia cuprina]
MILLIVRLSFNLVLVKFSLISLHQIGLTLLMALSPYENYGISAFGPGWGFNSNVG